MFNGIKTAVFFGAHTDDEMICAGTLHRLARNGVKVHVLTYAYAASQGDPSGISSALTEHVTDEFAKSMSTIGVWRSELTGLYPPVSLHERGQEIANIAYGYVERHKPELCIVLSPDDENPAHAEVGRQCERVMRGRVPYVIRCQFPWNYSVGRANLFVKLDAGDVEVKRAVINCYQSQLWRYRYEEMLIAQCRADGLSVKAEYAEKFELLRGVV